MLDISLNISNFAKKFAGFEFIRTFAIPFEGNHFGEMAEWSNAAVLITVDLHVSGGSNPSLSAEKEKFYN